MKIPQRRISELYHHLATSDAAVGRAVRRLRRGLNDVSVPAPATVVGPLVSGFVAARSAYHFAKRVLVCQPMFAAYCSARGSGLKTGSFLHWVQGRGNIIVGDHVLIDGKCTITFAARFSSGPTLEIGDHTRIGHDTDFTIGKRITIGRNCKISGATRICDSNGHPSDVEARRADEPPHADKVRPVVIGNDVWIAKNCVILPGVKIGDGAIVSAASVVREDVRPYTIVAGNPAREVRKLPGDPGVDGNGIAVPSNGDGPRHASDDPTA